MAGSRMDVQDEQKSVTTLNGSQASAEKVGAEADDMATLEKRIEFPTPTMETSDGSGPSKLMLSEAQALARAQALPDDKEPIYLTFSLDDKENPRNWSHGKKYYITAFVSMLNVLT